MQCQATPATIRVRRAIQVREKFNFEKTVLNAQWKVLSYSIKKCPHDGIFITIKCTFQNLNYFSIFMMLLNFYGDAFFLSFPLKRIPDPASVMVHVINGEHPAAMQHGNSSSKSLHSYRNRNSNFLTFHLSKWLLSSPTKMLSSIPTLLLVAISTVMCINFSMRWFMYGICSASRAM